MATAPDRLAAALADRYRIERELGQGGMATVYLAQDLKHDRKVALKVLHPHLAAVVGAERFLKEIQTTANLQHPHILALFDSGDADELLFYVMPFVEGESLRHRLERETRLPVGDAVRIAAEVASALDYAHRHGVIHRDIKPENILLHEGRALVADFGIALAPSAGGSRLTETGISMGTPPYMSPEQALGERALDARSDVYAVGAMLYEMLTGAPPFTGPSALAIVAKVLTEKPVPPSRLRREIPAQVEDAVLTALQKDPTNRFATAAALQEALAGTGPPMSRHRRLSRLHVLAAGVVIAVCAAALYIATRKSAPALTPKNAPALPLNSAPAAPRSIAMLPFTNSTGDSRNTSFSDGLSEEIRTSLSRRGLRIFYPSGKRYRDPGLDVDSAARALGAESVLTGEFRRADVSKPQDLYKLEDSLVIKIAGDLQLSLGSAGLAALNAGRTENPAAHGFLLQARGYITNRERLQWAGGLDTALILIGKALALDSTYVQAWAARASAVSLRGVYGSLTQRNPLADFDSAWVYAHHALKLDSTSAEALTTLGFLDVFRRRDYPGAGQEFARAIDLDPNQSNTWLFQAWYFVATNQLDSALWSMERAKQLNPLDPVVGTRLGWLHWMRGEDSLSEVEFKQVLARDSDFASARQQLAMVYADDHQCEKAMQELSRVDSAGLFRSTYAGLATALCHPSDARQYLDSMEHGPAPYGLWIAAVHGALHQKDSVQYWLNRAARDSESLMFMLRVWPPFKEYRSEPWFQNLERRLKLLPEP